MHARQVVRWHFSVKLDLLRWICRVPFGLDDIEDVVSVHVICDVLIPHPCSHSSTHTHACISTETSVVFQYTYEVIFCNVGT